MGVLEFKKKPKDGENIGNFAKDMERMAALFEILRIQYNFYFSGARKDLPTWERSQLDRLFAFYRNNSIAGIANQFKFNTFAHSYSIQCDQWGKMSRAKESGMIADPRMVQALRKAEKTLENLNKESPDAVRQRVAEEGAAKAKATPAARQSVPLGPTSSGPSGGQTSAPSAPTTRELFEIYQKARKANGDSGTMDPSAFERQIATQRQQILEKYKAKDVVFAVESKGGKVSLKAKLVK